MLFNIVDFYNWHSKSNKQQSAFWQNETPRVLHPLISTSVPIENSKDTDIFVLVYRIKCDIGVFHVGSPAPHAGSGEGNLLVFL